MRLYGDTVRVIFFFFFIGELQTVQSGALPYSQFDAKRPYLFLCNKPGD